jgi:hypothetical protein
VLLTVTLPRSVVSSRVSKALKRLALMSLRNPKAVPSAAAAHAALLFAHVGWNAALEHGVEGYERVLAQFTSTEPDLWAELRSADPAVLIEEARQAKLRLYPNDRRVILVCGIRDHQVHVEWCEGRDYPEAVRALRASLGLTAGYRGRDA